MNAPIGGRVLCIRPDGMGDVLLAGPAVRAVAARSRHVTLLAGPRGRAAADLLPGVDDVVQWRFPWIDPEPPPIRSAQIDDLVADLRRRRFDAALIFTSFHQSPLPTALVLKLADVPWVGAISVDYPGSLLDLRATPPGDVPEPERALGLATAAGFALPAGDDGRLRVRQPLPSIGDLIDRTKRYVVLHPGTSVPARAWPAKRFAETARLLATLGQHVVVTGSTAERPLTAVVAGDVGRDLGGRTDLPMLAAVLAGADAVVVANTGPAHLAAAVGSPVVSLFAPTVPATRWSPHGVPCVVLGDHTAACRDSRATHCPVEGHPCLTSVTAADAVRAVEKLGPEPLEVTP